MNIPFISRKRHNQELAELRREVEELCEWKLAAHVLFRYPTGPDDKQIAPLPPREDWPPHISPRDGGAAKPSIIPQADLKHWPGLESIVVEPMIGSQLTQRIIVASLADGPVAFNLGDVEGVDFTVIRCEDHELRVDPPCCGRRFRCERGEDGINVRIYEVNQ